MSAADDKLAGLCHLFSDTPTRGVRQPSISKSRAIWRGVGILYSGEETFRALVLSALSADSLLNCAAKISIYPVPKTGHGVVFASRPLIPIITCGE
jgi:hypothetical protein